MRAGGVTARLNRWEESVQAASHDGLGRAAAAGDGDAAEVRVDAAEQEGLLDLLLA